MAAFPDGFVWGVSTAAYQIEGGVKQNGRGPSIWDTFSHSPGRTRGGDSGDVACDHYHRYREDVALMAELGVGAYRFSLAWPRLMPTGRGRAHPGGIDFYSRLVDALLDAGIEPWVCLYHWDLPQALEDKGGWTNRDVAHWFADYAHEAASVLADRVRNFITFNEPGVVSLMGHGYGVHAPGRSSQADVLRAVHHLNLAHGGAVEAMRAVDANLHLGAVVNVQSVQPSASRDEEAAELLDLFWNKAFPDPVYLGEYPERLAEMLGPIVEDGDLARINQPVEFIGLNHYSPLYARADRNAAIGAVIAPPPAGRPVTGMGWEIAPAAFTEALLTVQERYGPMAVYVTENGYGADAPDRQAPDAGDSARIDYLNAYLAAAAAAIEQGVDLRGYFLWSLLDNFEWAEGYAKRFGIVHVDYETLKRTPKASYHWYQSVIANNRLP
ncbi:MAG: GH1 family beta-glucosidase [Sphingomonadales bacterium]